MDTSEKRLFPMSTIPVQLPEDLQEFVEATVQHGHFASANDYIVSLVEAARRKRSDIEAALIEGFESGPAEEWTREEWDGLKKHVTEKHREK
jgi:putative addiction module CopG family antidote